MYALILSGGGGTRLWPKSRELLPKQLHPLITEDSLLQETVKRVLPKIPREKIFLVTASKYLYKIKAQLPQISPDNYIIEPYPLGTASAIALGASKIKEIDPKAEIIVLWADNHVGNEKEFLRTLDLATKVCQEFDGVIIGVNPTYPATEYGYIKIGKELSKFGSKKCFLIEKFIEKPNLKKAKEFFKGWQYFWNSGISVWRVSKFLKLFEKFLPAHFKALKETEKINSIDAKQETLEKKLKIIEKAFKGLEKIPVDYAIYEKAKNLAVIPADLDWSDIGSWASLKDLLTKNHGQDNIIFGKHIGLDTKNVLIIGGQRLIATLGVKDLVIIDTDDAILIVDKDESQKVRDLVEELKKRGKKEYL